MSRPPARTPARTPADAPPRMPGHRPGRRRRLTLLLAALGVIVVGLSVHAVGRGSVADFAADALYAALAALLFAAAWPQRHPARSAALALLACTVVELLQLTGGPAALAAAVPPARLLFGTTFTAVDLVAYVVGVSAVLAIDMIAQRRPAPGRRAAETMTDPRVRARRVRARRGGR